MDEAFPKELCEKVYRDLTEYEIKSNGLERMCGPWMTCAVNVAVGNRSIVTKPHRDTQGFLFGVT